MKPVAASKGISIHAGTDSAPLSKTTLTFLWKIALGFVSCESPADWARNYVSFEKQILTSCGQQKEGI
jgi:hypothetical protein